MSAKADKEKPGPKPRRPGADWVVFQVSATGMQHLEHLAITTGLGDNPDEVAKELFLFELQRSMKDPSLHEVHKDHWLKATPPG